jgi:adenylate cyclase
VTSGRVERRLLAILAADVVGYARLVGLDEAGTVARLRSLRQAVIEPRLAERRGRLVKLMGDGFLCAFPSVLDAVLFAVALQKAAAAHEAARPAAERIRLRIGVHLGDVIVDGDDIHGEGVNIAARLEPLADPGGVLLSASAFEQVRGKQGLAFEDLGEQDLKNIERPVRAFRVAGLGEGGARPGRAAEPPSIAVLPFANLSADPEQDYFADGIAEDIITDLSKVAGLLVIARNSAFAYKGKSRDVRQVAQELGVRHVVEGSVRRAGSRVRVTAELIDGRTGGHLWAERYDRELSDIFAVQDELTAEIVGELRLELSAEESRRLARRGTRSVEAWDAFLRGRDLAFRHRPATFEAAKGFLERAAALDPAFAAPHAWLAQLHLQCYNNAWFGDPEAALAEARAAAERALAVDRQEGAGHFALGMVLMWSRELEAAEAEARRAIELGPGVAEHHLLLGVLLTYAGRPGEALDALRRAMRIDPQHPPLVLHFLAQALFGAERFAEAKAALDDRLRRDPASETSLVLRAACRGFQGDPAGARADWDEALRINPRYSLAQRRRILPYREPRDFERIAEGLRRAGIDVPDDAG